MSGWTSLPEKWIEFPDSRSAFRTVPELDFRRCWDCQELLVARRNVFSAAGTTGRSPHREVWENAVAVWKPRRGDTFFAHSNSPVPANPMCHPSRILRVTLCTGSHHFRGGLRYDVPPGLSAAHA